jgi:two-component system response regulator DesR
METIRILLVDDQPQIRRGLRMLLALEPDLEVVGEAGDGAEALAQVQEAQPDIVLMDVQMAGTNGLSAAHELHGEAPGARVIMVSLHDDAKTRLMARAAGAVDFVSKQQVDEALLDAIRRAADGTGSVDA